MTDERLRKAKAAVDNVVRSMFTKTDWVSIEVRPEIGCEGDEVLWIEGFYRGSGAELVSPKGTKVQFEILTRLYEMGETALPVPVFHPDGFVRRP